MRFSGLVIIQVAQGVVVSLFSNVEGSYLVKQKLNVSGHGAVVGFPQRPV